MEMSNLLLALGAATFVGCLVGRAEGFARGLNADKAVGWLIDGSRIAQLESKCHACKERSPFISRRTYRDALVPPLHRIDDKGGYKFCNLTNEERSGL